MKFLKKITSKEEAVEKEYNILYVTDNGEAIIKNGQEPTPTTDANVVLYYDDDSVDRYEKATVVTNDLIDTNKTLIAAELNEGVTSIGNSAFVSCHSLASVTIGNSVTSIGDSAFYECISLASVTIGNSVTRIESYLFEGCSSLASVTIPDSVTSIGDNAFYRCSSLTSVTIGSGVTSIDNSAFQHCPVDELIYSYGCTELVPTHITSMDSVYMPDSVTSIGAYVFGDCSELGSITIPNSVRIIDATSIDGCSSLTSITYNGIVHTSKCSIISALSENGVDLRGSGYGDSTALLDCYTIRFLDKDGYEIKSDVYVEGEMPIPPTDDEMQIEGYTFIGWDSEVTEAYEDKDYYAQYEEITYTIRFLDDDGSVLDEQTVSYGQYPSTPSDPYKEGYTFIGWDSDITVAYEDKDYYAQYEEE